MIWISKSIAKKKYGVGEKKLTFWCEAGEVAAKRSGRGWIIEEESLERKIEKEAESNDPGEREIDDRCRRIKRPVALRDLGKKMNFAALPVSVISGGHRKVEDPAMKLGFGRQPSQSGLLKVMAIAMALALIAAIMLFTL